LPRGDLVRNSREVRAYAMVSKFKGNLLIWPVSRTTRSFRVYVVQPDTHSPAQHGEIFRAAITALFSPPHSQIAPLASPALRPPPDHVDLVTFPEAFLLPEDLLLALRSFAEAPGLALGCIHVGLCWSTAPHQHLFSTGKIRELVAELSTLPIVTADLDQFQSWLNEQEEQDYFNIGCLFTKDAADELRVCLHPKMVRSGLEVSPLSSHHLKEANLLTLVTLLPEDRTLCSITIQPLLCSDILNLSTDRSHARPLNVVNTDRDSFATPLPDHIDIVSVATQTQRQNKLAQKGGPRPIWHEEFREALLRAAKDDALARHRYAIFVLSNVHTLDKGVAAGLSGGFIAAPLSESPRPSYVTVCAWGKPESPANLSNEWYFPDDETDPPQPWSSRGHFVVLNPPGPSPAYLFGFTIHRLLRDASRWLTPSGFVRFDLQGAARDSSLNTLFFQGEGTTDD
jgi:hypothetical protein